MATPFITKENAVALGRKGAAATAERWKQAQNLSRLIPAVAASVAMPPDRYVEKRLARVRKQIDRLSDLLDAEAVPQAIDRLAAAIERLGKLEQTLAGRPGPGNRKPAPERSVKSRRDLAPLPQPVVDDSPSPETPSPGNP